MANDENTRLKAVEDDIRASMKEAIKGTVYADKVRELSAQYKHTQSRKKLACQLGLLLTTLLTLSACGVRFEAWRYSPDEFERNERQTKQQVHMYDERMAK